MQDLNALDPTASLVDSGEPNAQFIPDASGREKLTFLGDEKVRLEKYLDLQLNKTIDDYTAIWAKRAENQKAYEGLSDKGEAITLPLARASTNQQHAWLMDRVFSATPTISVRALGDKKFQIVVQDPDTGVADVQQVTASDEAEDIQDLINHKWTYRLPMRKVLSDWAMEGLTDGTVPALVKIVHDPSKTNLTQRAVPQTATDETGKPKVNEEGRQIQIIDSPEYRTIVDGETIQPINVPGEDFLMPLGELDIQKSPWVSMQTEPDTSTVRKKIASGEWDFCSEEPSDEDIDAVLYAYENTADKPNKKGRRAIARLDKRTPLNPLQRHTVHEVFFRWPVMQPNAPDVIQWEELVGYYHLKAKKLLSCGKLDTWYGKRPFVDFFMRQRPNSYSGTCTVEDVAPFQRYASNLFHLQVQNMVMRNISVIMVRKGTSAAHFLQKKANIRPGMVIQVDEMDDVQLNPLGTPIESMSSEIAFLVQGADKMSLVTQYDTASADLTRVTAGAFAQQQDLSKMQPKQVYTTFAERVGVLALMYIQTLIQYAPEQIIPDYDPETNAILSRVINLPRQMVTDEMQFTLSATANDETPEAQAQQDAMLSQQITQANNFNMSVLGQIMVPGAPPEFQQLGVFMITRGELMLKHQFKNLQRHDVAKYVMSPDMINAAIASLQTRMQAMAQQGGQGGIPNAGGGGPVPPGAGGQPGLGAVQPQPGGQGMGAPGPVGNLPAQP